MVFVYQITIIIIAIVIIWHLPHQLVKGILLHETSLILWEIEGSAVQTVIYKSLQFNSSWPYGVMNLDQCLFKVMAYYLKASSHKPN